MNKELYSFEGFCAKVYSYLLFLTMRSLPAYRAMSVIVSLTRPLKSFFVLVQCKKIFEIVMFHCICKFYNPE